MSTHCKVQGLNPGQLCIFRFSLTVRVDHITASTTLRQDLAIQLLNMWRKFYVVTIHMKSPWHNFCLRLDCYDFAKRIFFVKVKNILLQKQLCLS